MILKHFTEKLKVKPCSGGQGILKGIRMCHFGAMDVCANLLKILCFTVGVKKVTIVELKGIHSITIVIWIHPLGTINQNLITIHPEAAKIFQSGQKWSCLCKAPLLR